MSRSICGPAANAGLRTSSSRMASRRTALCAGKGKPGFACPSETAITTGASGHRESSLRVQSASQSARLCASVSFRVTEPSLEAAPKATTAAAPHAVVGKASCCTALPSSVRAVS
jgi:hypothetical protein